jgi:hypothetical protein
MLVSKPKSYPLCLFLTLFWCWSREELYYIQCGVICRFKLFKNICDFHCKSVCVVIIFSCEEYFLVDAEILCEFGRLFQHCFFLLLDIINNMIKMSQAHTKKLINFHPKIFHEISEAYSPFSDCETYVLPILVFQLFHHLRYIFPGNRSSFEQWHMKHVCVSKWTDCSSLLSWTSRD